MEEVPTPTWKSVVCRNHDFKLTFCNIVKIFHIQMFLFSFEISSMWVILTIKISYKPKATAKIIPVTCVKMKAIMCGIKWCLEELVWSLHLFLGRVVCGSACCSGGIIKPIKLELESNHKGYPQLKQIMNSLDIFQTAIVFLHAHPQVVYYNCVKFHQCQFIH